MTLGRDARRRLALYGGGAALSALLVAAPWIVRRATPSGAGLVKAWDHDGAMKHEATRLLREYVRIDTSNPPGRTKEAIVFLERLLDCEGIAWEETGDDPERPILVARLPGRSRDGTLMLLHHADVVPPGELSKWTMPPFSGEAGQLTADSTFLYGRGTIDMKNIGVAQFLSIAALKRDGIVPRRDVLFVAESAEETFQPEAGVGWLFTHRPDLVAGVTDVFTEGGINECLTRNIDRFGIEILQKANLGWIVTAPGRAELEELKAFLAAEDARLPFRIVPEVREFFRFVGPARGDVWGRLILDPDRVLRGDELLSTLPDVYRGVMKDSIYSGAVEADPGGGFQLSVLWTLLPGSRVADVRARTEGWFAGRRLAARLRLASADSVATPRTGPAWGAMVRSLELDPVRAEVGIYVLNGSYTSSSWLRAHGIRSYGLSTFDITINDAGRAHNPSERIHVASFVEGVERMERVVREWATSR